jgi:hypothetical protein
MSEMVHIGEGSCSVERRGGTGRTCTVVSKIRKAVLNAFDRLLGAYQGGPFGANPNAALA